MYWSKMMTNEQDTYSVKKVTTALDNSVKNTDLELADKLTYIRQQALKQKPDNPVFASIYQVFTTQRLFIASLATIALSITLFMDFNGDIQPLPESSLVAELPIEEVATLSELEFVNWLAQQEESSHL